MLNALKIVTALAGPLALVAALAGCNVEAHSEGYTSSASTTAPGPGAAPGESLATFAGGCFWCIESPFEKVPGVTAVISGYTDGHKLDPTYQEVGGGGTGHTEAVEIHFDPSQVSYEDLLQIFWRQFDPTDAGGSFGDRGSQYRSGIFVHDATQRAAAEASKAALAASGRFDKPIVTEIKDATVFYPAEDYHQDYYKKSPGNYYSYRKGSGRDRFIDRVWGDDRTYEFSAPVARWSKPDDAVLREKLSTLQYRVTQEDATERSFNNEFWDNHAEGIYVDVVSGEPLFSSADKFKSGTGWPSFTRPLVPAHIRLGQDYKAGYARDEVRSRYANSHLGHVFDDGPAPTGKRYCMNSAAMRFVPANQLAAEGYVEFVPLFKAQASAADEH